MNVTMRLDWLCRQKICLPYRAVMDYVQKGYIAVYVCRNPYQRAVSAYVNKFYYHPELGEIASTYKLRSFCKELYASTQSLEPYLGWSFRDYLRAVRLAMFKHNEINGHWDTQLPRSCAVRFKPDYLVRVENFNEDLRQVISSLGLPDHDPQSLNRTYYEDGFEESDELLDKISSLELLRRRVALRPCNLLSQDSKKLIRQLYAEDFSYFGYDTA